jgi:hypothetical protein
MEGARQSAFFGGSAEDQVPSAKIRWKRGIKRARTPLGAAYMRHQEKIMIFSFFNERAYENPDLVKNVARRMTNAYEKIRKSMENRMALVPRALKSKFMKKCSSTRK